jgi:2-polyprenyl-3-methyl-5-hydroxy-6-metoxy-1,4-benzoquinol methylase
MPEQDMFNWYEKLYPDVESSKAYSKYCMLAFGNDFSQQCFSNIEQISFMLSKLHINAQHKVLDIGCGIGKLDEYMNDATGANIVGLDYSPAAVKIAKERTSSKQGLSFECGNMDEIDYPPNSFDVIFSIDAIFFSADLVKLLQKLNDMLKIGGKLAIYYSEIKFDEEASIDILLPQNTQVGLALEKSGLSYLYYDLTENLYNHMIIKRKTALSLKEDFAIEDKKYLFDYAYRESIPPDMSLSSFKKFQARYLYLHEK